VLLNESLMDLKIKAKGDLEIVLKNYLKTIKKDYLKRTVCSVKHECSQSFDQWI